MQDSSSKSLPNDEPYTRHQARAHFQLKSDDFQVVKDRLLAQALKYPFQWDDEGYPLAANGTFTLLYNTPLPNNLMKNIYSMYSFKSGGSDSKSGGDQIRRYSKHCAGYIKCSKQDCSGKWRPRTKVAARDAFLKKERCRGCGSRYEFVDCQARITK